MEQTEFQVCPENCPSHANMTCPSGLLVDGDSWSLGRIGLSMTMWGSACFVDRVCLCASRSRRRLFSMGFSLAPMGLQSTTPTDVLPKLQAHPKRDLGCENSASWFASRIPMHALSLPDSNESCCLLYSPRSTTRSYVSLLAPWPYLSSGLGCAGNSKTPLTGSLTKDNGWVKSSIEARPALSGGCLTDFAQYMLLHT